MRGEDVTHTFSQSYQQIGAQAMETIAWVLCSLSFLAASFAWWAAIMARSTLRELRRRLAERSTRSLQELDSEISNLTLGYASCTKTLKRLSSRLGMQDVRERRSQELEPPPTNPQERKAYLRKNLAAGKLRVVRDSPGHSE